MFLHSICLHSQLKAIHVGDERLKVGAHTHGRASAFEHTLKYRRAQELQILGSRLVITFSKLPHIDSWSEALFTSLKHTQHPLTIKVVEISEIELRVAS